MQKFIFTVLILIISQDLQGQLIPGSFNVLELESKSMGVVPAFVYLPPSWDPASDYPLVVFLHGQGEDERSMLQHVSADSMNEWIESGKLDPVVLLAVKGNEDPSEVQWFHAANEKFLIGEDDMRAICRQLFSTSIDASQISIEGFSRGGTGAIFLALKHPQRFASAVSNSFVSDYAIRDLRTLAFNLDKATPSAKLLIEIGDKDQFVLKHDRQGFKVMHELLDSLSISHEYKVLPGVQHHYGQIWNYSEGDHNGLRHLLFHQNARKP